MDPSEVEFVAEKCKVSVVPNFAHDRLYMISGDVGPFVAGIPLEIPLWLAVNLRKRHKCRMLAPEWLDVDKLEEKKQEEMDSKVFTKMPCDAYMEVSHVILSNVADIPRADEIRTLVKDICDLRMAKLRSSIDAFIKSDEIHAKLDHLTMMEINTVRTLLTSSLDNLHRIRRVSSQEAAALGPFDYLNCGYEALKGRFWLARVEGTFVAIVLHESV